MGSVAAFTTLLVLGTLVGLPLVVWAFKAGRNPPQQFSFLVSLLLRRVLLPVIDVLLDWIVCFTFLASSKKDEFFAGIVVLVVLIIGSIAVGVISALAVQKEYKYLKSLEGKNGPDSMGRGCLAGILQGGPIFLGLRAVRAWREVTDHPKWRLPGTDSETTQEALDAFIELTANLKHSVQFQALYEGGPQLVIQLLFLVRDRDELSESLSDLEIASWMRILSTVTSSFTLILSQLDFLCENDRFLHRKWRRDAPPVVLCTLVDLMSQLAVCIVPLVLLLDHNAYAGGVAVMLQVIGAAYVTMRNGDHSDPDAEVCIDLCLVPFLFFPHAFLFAMTYYPGHAESGPNKGQSLDFHTAQHALLSQNGLMQAIAHVLYAFLVASMIAALPACCYDWFDINTTVEDFNGAFRIEAAFTTLGTVVPCMILARVGMYKIEKQRPHLFDQDCSPQLALQGGAPRSSMESTLEGSASSLLATATWVGQLLKRTWKQLLERGRGPPRARVQSCVTDGAGTGVAETTDGQRRDVRDDNEPSSPRGGGTSEKASVDSSPATKSVEGHSKRSQDSPKRKGVEAARLGENEQTKGGAKLVIDRI